MKTENTALRAIVARIDGVFDEPHLAEYGALSTNTLLDVRNIALDMLGSDAPTIPEDTAMRTFAVTIGAALRGYTEMEIAATSAEAAREDAFERLKAGGDGTTQDWYWRLESVQGDVSIRAVIMASEPDAEGEFVDMDFNGPSYPDLESFASQVSRCTTPEDEFAGMPEADRPDSPDDIQMDSDRLGAEYQAFMQLVRDARKLLKQEG